MARFKQFQDQFINVSPREELQLLKVRQEAGYNCTDPRKHKTVGVSCVISSYNDQMG